MQWEAWDRYHCWFHGDLHSYWFTTDNKHTNTWRGFMSSYSYLTASRITSRCLLQWPLTLPPNYWKKSYFYLSVSQRKQQQHVSGTVIALFYYWWKEIVRHCLWCLSLGIKWYSFEALSDSVKGVVFCLSDPFITRAVSFALTVSLLKRKWDW